MDSHQTVGVCQVAIYRGFGNKPNAGSITSPNALTCIKAFIACRLPQFTKKDTWQFLKRNIGRQCKIGGSRCRLERASTKPQAALSSTCNTSPSRTTAPELLPPGQYSSLKRDDYKYQPCQVTIISFERSHESDLPSDKSAPE
jgi:hypothetical protein